MKNTEDVRRALEIAIASIDRDFGKGSVIRLGEKSVEPWPAVPTGALPLDLALGIGGLPRGRIVEIYGSEGVGKSTLAMSLVAEAQKSGLEAVYVDVEHAVDPIYARKLGVDMDNLLISQPDSGEDALEIVDRLIRTGEVGIIVVDSVAALVPKAELDGEMSDQQMGAQARLMAKGMRKIVGAASRTQTLVVFINQIREKIGIMFGNPETTPGGRSLKFYSSVRIQLLRVEDVKDRRDGSKIGLRVKARLVKNKMAPPFKEAEFDILYGKGIHSVGCIFDVALTKGIVTKAGAWYSLNGETLSQGRPDALDKLESDPELLEKLRGMIVDNDG